MTEIIERNKHWLVKSKFGSFPFNNKQSAEQLQKVLNNYEKDKKTLTKLQSDMEKLKGVLNE